MVRLNIIRFVDDYTSRIILTAFDFGWSRTAPRYPILLIVILLEVLH